MHPLTTKFTALMNIQSPIVGAPMYFATTPDMVVAVSGSGGFGFIAAGFESSETLKKQLQYVRSKLNVAAGIPLPTGVGLLGWILDKTEISDDPRIPAVLDELPAAIWFAFGTNLGKYVEHVRAYDEKRDPEKPHKTLVFVIVNSVEDALRAANEWKVDVLVVQGTEAGGHGGASAPPLLNLLQGVLDAIPTDGPAIIAAGGISTGAQIAALLTLGASGVVLGTRFLFTPECMYSDQMKAVLLDAGLNSTARSLAFDEINRTAMWPEGIDGRAIANNILVDYREGKLDLETRLKKADADKANGKTDRLVIWAGVGVGHVKEIKGASEVLRCLHEETVAALITIAQLQ
ncbi:uncharacterized protein LACBIDRAFT_310141 [Laccaria bicolor S238N-H82]|uniref:Predicted protein n=1 Tax=Laccaria bicolor (strain S238N-H82 / ATCC MYA-4686) TaxID=486041 RepID=B0DTX3_LACBS|nr:uncharacterized protein LACBIDRAFT_310141 [Laccaria bicolor S238N-H82]EDR01987.1 predicted protein [Laccaria bicolor S238N-H82]|eukprot:XP_001887378.1 predicted protein [Laccaria bicolor S238N-H82]